MGGSRNFVQAQLTKSILILQRGSNCEFQVKLKKFRGWGYLLLISLETYSTCVIFQWGGGGVWTPVALWICLRMAHLEFLMLSLILVSYFAQNMDLMYSLEPPH